MELQNLDEMVVLIEVLKKKKKINYKNYFYFFFRNCIMIINFFFIIILITRCPNVVLYRCRKILADGSIDESKVCKVL